MLLMSEGKEGRALAGALEKCVVQWASVGAIRQMSAQIKVIVLSGQERNGPRRSPLTTPLGQHAGSLVPVTIVDVALVTSTDACFFPAAEDRGSLGGVTALLYK